MKWFMSNSEFNDLVRNLCNFKIFWKDKEYVQNNLKPLYNLKHKMDKHFQGNVYKINGTIEQE